jgi:hypothetical protein
VPADIYAFKPADTTTKLLVADDWLDITFHKESSGIVVIGTKEDLAPIGQGRGVSLPSDRPFRLTLAPGTILYALGEDAEQKLSVVLQPSPIVDIVTAIKNLAATIAQAAGRDPISASSGVSIPNVPTPGTADQNTPPIAVGGADYYKQLMQRQGR